MRHDAVSAEIVRALNAASNSVLFLVGLAAGAPRLVVGVEEQVGEDALHGAGQLVLDAARAAELVLVQAALAVRVVAGGEFGVGGGLAAIAALQLGGHVADGAVAGRGTGTGYGQG